MTWISTTNTTGLSNMKIRDIRTLTSREQMLVNDVGDSLRNLKATVSSCEKVPHCQDLMPMIKQALELLEQAEAIVDARLL